MINFFGKSLNKLIIALVIFLLSTTTSCSLFSSFSDNEDDDNQTYISNISSLTLSKQSLSLKVGTLDYITLKVSPTTAQKNAVLSWSYDTSVISCDTSSKWGITITGIKEGQTSLKCSCSGYDATCLITVSGYSDDYTKTVEPYIYSNSTILQTSPGITEKVFVSLYGGDASDIDGYTWSIDNTSVASIEPTGQYCLITAKETGYARIKITHTKAAYPYYIGIYVFDDATNMPYITTSNNIFTLNQADGEKDLSVSLVNGRNSSLDTAFSWKIITEEGSSTPITLSANSNKAIITPKQSGSCTVRITHPDATYPLDILCRVITIVDSVYIEPDSTIITLDGTGTGTITSSLKNIKIGDYSVDDFQYSIENTSVAKIESTVGNIVNLKGLANGSTKLIISHSKAAYSRECLLIVTGQLSDAIDSSFYITTSQNYIKTKVGAADTSINIMMKGGTDGDEKDYNWSVLQSPEDGASDVISLATTNGTTNSSLSRAATISYSYGTAYITPKSVGTATIKITHPKAYYPTEILVKVLDESAVLENPMYFSGAGIVKFLNSNTLDYNIKLNGDSVTTSDINKISWSTDSTTLKINATGENAVLSSSGAGNCISSLLVKHPNAEAEKKILVLTADTQEELENIQGFYADKTYYAINVGKSINIYANSVGFEGTTELEKTTWTSADPDIASVEKSTSDPLTGILKGNKTGKTKITAKYSTNCQITFSVTVYPENVDINNIEKSVYFTTSQNVINITQAGESKQASVTAVGLDQTEYSNITWTSSNESIAKVIGNGTSATITSAAEGETIITVKHSSCENELKIYVRIGSEYVPVKTDPVVYISAPDVITMLKDAAANKLQAVLVNYNGADSAGFTFNVDNSSIATISAQSTNGTAFIKPVSSGQCEISITHPKTAITKKVLVIVGNSAEELAGYTYLTTSQNVVSIGEGSTKNISVSVANAENPVISGYSWESSNPGIIGITATGANAVLTGNSIGTSIITVTNSSCLYKLQIIAQCVDPKAAAANPYIQLTSSVMTLSVGTTYTSITADLVGGTSADFSDFVWTSADSSICAVYGQNEIGKARAMQEGRTYITVSHPKAAYSAQILVVCDKQTESECYINVASSILSMKPDDTAQSVSVSLVNGTATDKYNFKWSLDVYDIIDLQYANNTCTIKPLTTGTATITISHPKAAYDQQIIVNVQEYSTFKFPKDYITLTQGTVNFITMEVPTTSVATYVEYSVENSGICTISGTKNVAQVTAVGAGTSTVTAKLIASSTGVVQAASQMMVYSEEKATNAVYISSSKSIYTVNKGKSETLSAYLTGEGVTSSDQYNLKWTTKDTDIIQITGISADGTVKGDSIYVTALKPGEALITCSHEKAASNFQFYIVVPGTEQKVITLNKNFMTLTKGTSGTTIKATIENAESSSDYYDIQWTCEGANGKDIARIMGSGKTVTIYPISVGEATVRAQLPDSSIVAECTVKVEADKSFVFDTNSRRVQPFHTKTVGYTVSPADAVLNWTTSQDEEYFSYKDLGCDSEGKGSVEITGIKEGSGTLVCISNGSSAKGTISVNVSWDYSFTINKYAITGTPNNTYSLEYKISPVDAIVSVSNSAYSTPNVINNGDGTGVITFVPKLEGIENLNVTAKNKDTNEIFKTTNISLNFSYTSLSVYPVIASRAGSFSNYNSNSGILTIGDGETLTIGAAINETKADFSYKAMSYTAVNGSTISLKGASSSDKMILSDNNDEQTKMWRITEDTDIYVAGQRFDPGEWVYVSDGGINAWRSSNYIVKDITGVEKITTYGQDGDERDSYEYIELAFSQKFYLYRLNLDNNADSLGAFLGFYKKETGDNYTTSISYTFSGAIDTEITGNYNTALRLPNDNISFQQKTIGSSVYYTKSEFENNARYFAPAADGYYKKGFGNSVSISHLNAYYINATASMVTTTSTSLISSTLAGYLSISYYHLGKEKTLKVPVYREVRGCVFNQ